MQTELDSNEKSRFRRKLLAWFDRHQRDLPWRSNRSPYRVWVSEIMLQQTQVATVIPYFQRFIQSFPTIGDLAEADESEVLLLWEGLGYYRRARQLHAAAKFIVDRHGGKFPDTFEEVLALPGIGRYTAGAILSIAREQRHPILEGNTIRLFSRLLGLQEDPRTTPNQRLLWEFSESLLPNKRVGDFNQALMEVGSLVCSVKSPRCLLCPLLDFCEARRTGNPETIPVAGPKVTYQALHEAAVIIMRRQRILVRQCGPQERWAGLWDFPRYDLASCSTQSQTHIDWLAHQIKRDFGLRIEMEPSGKTIRHAVTKYRIKLDCFRSTLVTGKSQLPSSARWVTLEDLQQLPLSATGRILSDRIQPS